MLTGPEMGTPTHPVPLLSKKLPFVGENPIYGIMEHNQSHQPNNKHLPETMLYIIGDYTYLRPHSFMLGERLHI